MVITHNSKRIIDKPGLIQGPTKWFETQRNSVKSPIWVKQPSLRSDSYRVGTARNQMEAKTHNKKHNNKEKQKVT
jgi:hypothetical protein